MTTHPLNARAVPRPVAQRLTPDDVACAERAQAAYREATKRDGILDGLRTVLTPQAYALLKHGRSETVCQRLSPALARVGAELVALANAGATQAECLLFPQMLTDLIAACYGGTARRDLDAVDREEAACDGIEDLAQMERRIAQSPATLRAEIAAVDRVIAINTERRCVLDAELRAELRKIGTAGIPTLPRTATLTAMGGR